MAQTSSSIDPSFIQQIRTKLSALTVEHYINGRWSPGVRGEVFETLDPSTNRTLASGGRGHAEDVDVAHKPLTRHSRNGG